MPWESKVLGDLAVNMQLQPPNANMGPSPFMLAPQETEEAGFDFWGVLRRRKWLVFLGLLAGLAVGGIYNSQCQKIYESKATVTISPKEKRIFQMGSGDQYDDSNKFDFRHDKLIAEDNILNKCLNTYGLKDLPTLRDLPFTDQIKAIQTDLVVQQNRDEYSMYELEYSSLSPRDAQKVLATVVSTYEKHLNDQYRQVTSDTMELLQKMSSRFQKEVKDVDTRLTEARNTAEKLAVAGDSNHVQRIIAESMTKIDAEKSMLSELTNDLARSETAIENGREACLEQIWLLEADGKIKGGSINIQDNSEMIARERIRIEELELARETLIRVQKLGMGHSQVQAYTLQINNRKEKIEALEAEPVKIVGMLPEQIIQRYIVGVKQNITDLRLTLDSDNAYYRHNYEKAVKSARAVAEVEDLRLEKAKLVDKLDVADRQIIEQESSRQTNLHKGFRFTTTRPAYRGREVWPLLGVILPIAGLLGSMLGFGLGCLVELADKTFHNPDEITRWLQVPLIGHIPVITQGKRYLVENSLIEPIVCTYHRPKSQVSEAFRAVRTALYFNTQGKQNSVIQVTSPTPGDGKSTLASNLAVSIAQSGKRVLLVDADMRRPRQHSTFGISSRVGFATVLSGQSEWRNCMFECEEIEGLTVMPCGAKPQNPAELSSSPQVKILIEEMREEFDFVIIDTPPMLAVTDPSPIAARVDGVVLCIRIKKNVRVSAERATQLIQNLGANTIGLVVNGVGAQSGYGSQYTYGAYRAGYSYNGYGYGYGYGTGGSGKYYDEDQRGRQARRDESVGNAPALIESEK